MAKMTLRHIGVVSLGRILGVVSFVIQELIVVLMTVLLVLASLLGLAQGDSSTAMGIIGGGIVGAIIFFVMGSVGAVVSAIFVFIIGAIIAIVYNVILGVGGGLDLDFDERG